MSTGLRQHLRRAIELARQARDHGNHPFGAVLVDHRGNVVLEAENTVRTDKDVTAHAETNLMRMASARFEPDFLERCTLYTSTEPCAMCAGAIYWGNVRRVVFGLSQEQIRSMSNHNPENMQLAITSREIFERGDHPVEVSGPHLPKESSAVHDGFWDCARGQTSRGRARRSTSSSTCPPIQLTAHTTMTVPTYVQKPSMEKFGAIHSASAIIAMLIKR
jgi:tRNA(Arg) A34 adenosine deaminase TadA